MKLIKIKYLTILVLKWLCRPSLVDPFNNPSQLGFGLAKGLISTICKFIYIKRDKVFKNFLIKMVKNT